MPRMTQAEVNAYLARVSSKVNDDIQTGAALYEYNLHDEILAECRRRGWIALHGSMAHKTHRTIGEPDFVILAEYPRVLLVEAKSRTGKPSPEQLALHAWATRLGHKVHVVRSLTEFIQVCDL